eukprot:979973_1
MMTLKMKNIVCLLVVIRLLHSKFIDHSLLHTKNVKNENEFRSINLSQNEILGEPFKTSQNVLKYKTQQKYRGIPIFGATLVIDQNNHIPIYGKWYDESDIEKLVPFTEPKINKEEIEQIALDSLDITAKNMNSYTNVDSELYIYYYKSHPYLCWIIRFAYNNIINNEKENKNEMHNPMFIINAINGEIYQIYDESYSLKIEACGEGGNQGKLGRYQYCMDKPPLFINHNPDSAPVLENDIIQIYDNYNNIYNDHSAATKITCSNLRISPINSTYQRCDIDDIFTNGAYCPACDVYAYANAAFDMFGLWTNALYPISPSFIPMKIYIHVGTNWLNANYIYSNGHIHFGDGTSDWYPLTVLDITAHEIAHGYTDQGSNLIYAGESGGMNEAFSDIAGEAAEYWVFGTNDWEAGGNLGKNGQPFRYMYDPPLNGRAIDHYSNFYPGMSVHSSSGLYNKAAYNLYATSNWTMEEIFRVFAWANLYYWTMDSTFNEGINGLHHALNDIYNDINIDGTRNNDLDLAFANVGLVKINVDETLNDTIGDGILCGMIMNRLCYYQNMSVSNNEITNHTVHIQANNDNTFTYFHIFFTVTDEDCMRPSLSLKYELIDYDSPSEYFEVFDNDNTLINRCQGGQWCGAFDSECINNFDLGISAITRGKTYQISVIDSPEVDDLCGTRLTMNAFVTLQCEYGTLSPTTQTISPIPTTPIPITIPGCESIKGIISCNESVTGTINTAEGRRHCYEFNITDSFTNNNMLKDVTFSDCASLFDTKLFVYDSNGIWISEPYCDGDDCGVCINEAKEEFTVPKMNPNYTYYVIIEPWSVGGQYQIEIECNDHDYSEIDTFSLCQKNPFPIWCYNIYLYPNNTLTKTVTIAGEYRASDVYFNISFIPRGTDCLNPFITFEYEQIDISKITEYINIRDDTGILLKQCQGNGGRDTQCGVWWECLSDYNLGITQIKQDMPYQIQIMSSYDTHPLCFTDHRWNINAQLHIRCDTMPKIEDKCDCTSDICYFVDTIGCSHNEQVMTYQIITNINDVSAHSFGICYNIINEDCINPRFSFEYEQIDYDSFIEYLSIYDNNNYLLKKCGGNISNLCGVFDECLHNHYLNVQTIPQNTLYQITINQTNYVNALCEDNNIQNTYSMNGRATLHCGIETDNPSQNPTPFPTLLPTQIPSFIPTKIPTDIPSVYPSLNPTLFPTTDPCKGDECYYITVTESNTITTVSNYNNIDHSLFYIYYTFEEYNCDNPKLSFEYEKIDIDRAHEYITVEANNIFISDCGIGTNECGVMEQCFENTRLDKIGAVIGPINIGKTLEISVFISDYSNALCETAHQELYTINSKLTLKCIPT